MSDEGYGSVYYQDDAVTLYHGDCLKITEWLAADVLVTDPPYGVPGGRVSTHDSRFEQLVNAGWDDLKARDSALGLWGDRPRAVFSSPSIPGLAHRGIPLVWDKEALGMGDTGFPFGRGYELIYVNGDGWAGPRRSAVIRCHLNPIWPRRWGHPTPKPVGLMSVLIRYAPAGVIADPFAGSGSTLVAAKALGRKSIGVEIDEPYCEIAAMRLSQGVLDFEEPA
jgi:hypothetical protein